MEITVNNDASIFRRRSDTAKRTVKIARQRRHKELLRKKILPVRYRFSPPPQAPQPRNEFNLTRVFLSLSIGWFNFGFFFLI